MKKQIAFALLILLVPFLTKAQKKGTLELDFALGTTHTFTDLGGGSGEGTTTPMLSLKDLDGQTTRYVIQAGVRYNVFSRLAVRGTFSFARLFADDQYSEEKNRQMRNLRFKSNVLELGAFVEFSILNAKPKRSYTPFTPSSFWNNLNIYVFGGISGFHFNPQGENESGEWVDLQPLATEGQGLPSDPNNPDSELNEEPYSLWAASFPFGIGFRYYLTQQWAIGLRISNRYTTTDYLDDAHGSYYDNDKLKETNPDAAFLADQHLFNPDALNAQGQPVWSDGEKYPHGQTHRGNPDNDDAFAFFTFTLSYTFKAKLDKAKFR